MLNKFPAQPVKFEIPPTSFLTLIDYIKSLSYVAYWPLDDVANNPFCRVINPDVAQGRNLILNGGADSDTIWVKSAGTTIAGGVIHFDGTTANGTAAQTPVSVFVAGRAYTAVMTVRNYVSGGIRFRLGSAQSLITRTANGTYSQTFIWAGTQPVLLQTDTFFVGDVDDIGIFELNIPASDAVPVQLLNTDVWNGLGSAWWTPSNCTLSTPTITRHDGVSGTVLRLTRTAGANNSAFSPAILTVGQVYRIYGWAKGDGTASPRVVHNGVTLFTGTTSTDFQPYDTSPFVATSTSFQLQSIAASGSNFSDFDVTVVALDTGIRQGNVVLDGDATSGIGAWTAVNSAVVSHQSGWLRVAKNTAGSSAPAMSQSVITGKTYLITGKCRSDGFIQPVVQDTATNLFTGTTSTSDQLFSIIRTFTSTGLRFGEATNSINPSYVEFTNIVVTEISPLVAVPVNGAILGNTETNRLLKSVSFDGVNDAINLYSAQLNSIFPTDEGSLVVFGKYTGSWTDGVSRRLVTIQVDANNNIQIRKSTTNNRITLLYTAGGTTNSGDASTTTTSWFSAVLTWSKSADQVNLYFNGVQVGSALTGLGTWVGNLSSTAAILAASTLAGANPFTGFEAHVALFNTPLNASQIAEIAKLGDAS